MNIQLTPTFLLTAAIVLSVSANGFAQHAHSDIAIGHDAANKIQIEADLDEAIELQPIAPGGLISGYSIDDPGWNVLEVDEPDEGLFSFVGDGSQMRLHVDSLTGDLVVRDPEGGLADIGPFFDLGNDFHKHLLFHSAGAEIGDHFSATFHLSDTGGNLLDSDPFTLRFTVVPEPATLAVFGFFATFLRPGRRRKGR